MHPLADVPTLSQYKADLHSVGYDSLDAPRSRESHGDEFWGTALAMWGPNVSEKKMTIRPRARRY